MAKRKTTKKFNGKTFSSFISFKKKSSATKQANSLRKRGFKVRIIKNKTKFPYEVFIRR